MVSDKRIYLDKNGVATIDSHAAVSLLVCLGGEIHEQELIKAGCKIIMGKIHLPDEIVEKPEVKVETKVLPPPENKLGKKPRNK